MIIHIVIPAKAGTHAMVMPAITGKNHPAVLWQKRMGPGLCRDDA